MLCMYVNHTIIHVYISTIMIVWYSITVIVFHCNKLLVIGLYTWLYTVQTGYANFDQAFCILPFSCEKAKLTYEIIHDIQYSLLYIIPNPNKLYYIPFLLWRGLPGSSHAFTMTFIWSQMLPSNQFFLDM